MNPAYRFPGMKEFITPEIAATISENYRAKIPGLYFVARVTDALSQIPETAVENRQSMLDVADTAIAALKASVAVVEAARATIVAECLPAAPDVPETPGDPSAKPAKATPSTPAKAVPSEGKP